MQKNEITAETYVGVVEVERRDGAVATSKHHQCCRLDAVVPLQIQRRWRHRDVTSASGHFEGESYSYRKRVGRTVVSDQHSLTANISPAHYEMLNDKR